MNTAPRANENFRLKLNFEPAIQFSEQQFYAFCRLNRELRIERNTEKEVLIMSPTGGETGYRNSEIIIQLGIWAKKDKTAIVFDSSTGFILPNGAIRSPDASWMKYSRLASLTPEQKRNYIPLCPDFVIELCSPLDVLNELHNKMIEYINNGALLGWLIDPEEKNVYIFRPGKEIKYLHNADSISGEDILPGFVLNLQEIWEVNF